MKKGKGREKRGLEAKEIWREGGTAEEMEHRWVESREGGRPSREGEEGERDEEGNEGAGSDKLEGWR